MVIKWRRGRVTIRHGGMDYIGGTLLQALLAYQQATGKWA